MKPMLWACTGLLLLATQAFAAAPSWRDDALPNSADLEGKPVVLNGMGVRQATILNVKVYVAGLYVEKPSTDPQEILSSPGVKGIEMKFVHDVSPSQMNDAWKESYERNCGSDCPSLRLPYAKLESLMVPLKPGDTMSFVFDSKGVTAQVKDSARVRIDGAAFSHALLATWLGPEPADNDLKRGLLKGGPKLAPARK